MRQHSLEYQPEQAVRPPWTEIDTVMFDMDGTLLDLHFDNYFWQTFVPRIWAENSGMDFDTASARLTARYAEVRGTLDWYCLDFWAGELNLDITALKREVRHRIAIRPNVIGLLERLREAGKRILLITNAHPNSLEIKLQQTGIGDYFDNRISSHSLRLAKENHGFWAALMNLEHYDPQRTLLVDDSLPVLRQARREGLRHLYGISQPDSQQGPLVHEEFPLIVDFAQFLPVSGAVSVREETA